MSNPAATQTWPTFLDYEEVVGYLQFDTPPQGAVVTRLQRFIDAACTEAQASANRPFAPTQFTERHDGWSGEYIQLHYSPFLGLVTCTEWQSSGGPIALTESTPENPTEGLQIDYGTSRIMRVFAGYSWPRPFFPGSRNIEVTYIAGFNPIPPDVWMATCELVQYWYRNTQEAARVSTFAAGDFDAQGSSPLWPGVPNRIADVFSRYRIPIIG